MFVLVVLGIFIGAEAHMKQVIMKNFVMQKCMLGVVFKN